MPIFAQGVTKNKLTILYTIHASKVDITREQLYRVMVENDVMSYFDYQNCMHELEEDAFIAAVPRAFGQTYRVSVRGADVLDQFVESLPVSLRERLDRYAREHREEMLLQTQIVSDMDELPSGGYIVRLRALEQKREWSWNSPFALPRGIWRSACAPTGSGIPSRSTPIC